MKVENIEFKTRARTIDHLGREQIADCPTAVSELWRNAYDAYSKNTALNIYDGDIPVASLVDDGHGMSRKEFVEKWLVVGTESKAISSHPILADRNGLPERAKQGQKGIGRLSCANLGSLLLLLSKRKDTPFVAALIDWRIFENPFLMLQDIRVPVVEFDFKGQLRDHLNEMFDTLMSNIWGSGKVGDKERDERIMSGWRSFDDLESAEIRQSTKSSIENTIIQTSFEDRHFESWGVWSNEADQGTAMFMANISEDLLAQLVPDSQSKIDDATARSKERLVRTLLNFTDPFIKPNEVSQVANFSTSVIAWNGLVRRPIIDNSRILNFETLEQLEHFVEGEVDEEGIFRGKLKVFGKWLDKEVIISPKEFPKRRSDTVCGPFQVRIATFEQVFSNTTLSEEQRGFFLEQAKLYSGLMVHRDCLRVMPYGRPDNDYFEIEKRRTYHAGRNFWANENIFGRVAITRRDNPNLKDKAGREGLIDNKASKTFRYLVENILMETGKKYFGSGSENRKTMLPDIQAQRAREKAEDDKKKMTLRLRREFNAKLNSKDRDLTNFLQRVEGLMNELEKKKTEENYDVLSDFKERASFLADEIKDFSLSPVPAYIGAQENKYRDYRVRERRALALISDANASINIALERVKPKSPKEAAVNELQRNAAQLHSRIRKWSNEGRSILASELERFNALVDERNKIYHASANKIIEELDAGGIELGEALNKLGDEYQKQYQQNLEIFPSYISSLGSMRDHIDLHGLVTYSLNESVKLQEEIERLHALAQLGITVEIIGHEIEGLDMTINRGLQSLPEAVKATDLYSSIMSAQLALSDRWRFLSPLKLSGEKISVKFTGEDIFDYVLKFFGDSFENGEVQIRATEAFKRFRFFEQPARVYPVFVNLVNNARYWATRKPEVLGEILLDVMDNSVIVADNGPGVDEDDIDRLFTLFFTRKQRGGRGIGLYLCRTNLVAGGHSIRYETDSTKRILTGANFVVNFAGTHNV